MLIELLAATVPDLLNRHLIGHINKNEVGCGHQLTLAGYLCAIEPRSLYLNRIFGILFDYAVTELGYIALSAWQRIQERGL